MAAKSRSKGMKAYVLIETAPGKTKAVRKELASVSPRYEKPVLSRTTSTLALATGLPCESFT